MDTNATGYDWHTYTAAQLSCGNGVDNDIYSTGYKCPASSTLQKQQHQQMTT